MTKKTLKTILSMCMILALVASLSVSAFAEGTTTKDTLYLITTNDHGNVNPAESIGESVAGHMVPGSPAILTRWSRDWEMISVITDIGESCQAES